MNATTAFLVNQQIDELRADAHRRYLAREAKGPGLIERIVSGLASALTGSRTGSDLTLPKLDGYPYRG